MRNVKCVVVGDGSVGKTCLLWSFAHNSFPGDYIATVFDNYNASVDYKSEPIMLGLWDTAGQHDMDATRTLVYPETNVVMICFSLADMTSYKNVDRWWAEVKVKAAGVPIVLVGTKLDLRNAAQTSGEKSVTMVTSEMGEQLKQKIGASVYLEVSAKEMINTAKPFEEAVRISFEKQAAKKQEQKKCCVVQ